MSDITLKFIEKAKSVHGDKYDYTLTDYINNRTKVCIICPIHGKFEQTPKDHLKGCGCPLCFSERRKQAKTNVKGTYAAGTYYIYNKYR